MANSVVHFEIFASDVEKTRKFYEQVFGWRFEAGPYPDFYHIYAGSEGDPGLTMGLLAKRHRQVADKEASTNAFRCTISVKSVKDAMAAVEAAGGTLRSPVTEIPVGKVAEISDNDGNVMCLMEYPRGHALAAR
jgi:predicted enzyme related to lactoylglutathione lyase